MAIIVPDMRYIERIDSEESGAYYVSKRTLCNHCGASGRCKSEDVMRARWVSYTYKECHAFVPVLTFRAPLKGFDGEFNTFRLGQAWAKRVDRGTTVALLETQSQSVFALATVESVSHGCKREMARAHALSNHLMKGRELSADEAEKEMLRILRNMFGKLIFDNHDTATVIHMRSHGTEDTEGAEQLSD